MLEGKASIPALPVGEDDFVELDAEGRPKSSPEGRRPVAAKRPARKTGLPRACRLRLVPRVPRAPRPPAESAEASGTGQLVASPEPLAEAAPAAGDTEAQA